VKELEAKLDAQKNEAGATTADSKSDKDVNSEDETDQDVSLIFKDTLGLAATFPFSVG